MHACLYIYSKSIEIKEGFKFTILKRLKFLAKYWFAIFRVSTAEDKKEKNGFKAKNP